MHKKCTACSDGASFYAPHGQLVHVISHSTFNCITAAIFPTAAVGTRCVTSPRAHVAPDVIVNEPIPTAWSVEAVLTVIDWIPDMYAFYCLLINNYTVYFWLIDQPICN
jgi:hypothetical protein